MTDGHDDLAYRVARRIATKRRERGLSQEAFAAALGIAVKNVQRIESGKQNLSLATLERISAALGVVPEALLVGPLEAAERTPEPRLLARLADAGYVVRTATEVGRRPRNAVPVMTLRAAAGAFSRGARAVEVVGWVTLPRSSPPPEGQFVAEVRGDSMEPLVPSGALCLFGRSGPAPFRKRVMLVSHDTFNDEDLGGPYAMKRVRSPKRLRDGRARIVLESINPARPPMVIDVGEGELRIIAELIRVLVPRAIPAHRAAR
jgi:transcriptional regulator with XRE-family HTH domain